MISTMFMFQEKNIWTALTTLPCPKRLQHCCLNVWWHDPLCTPKGYVTVGYLSAQHMAQFLCSQNFRYIMATFTGFIRVQENAQMNVNLLIWFVSKCKK